MFNLLIYSYMMLMSFIVFMFLSFYLYMIDSGVMMELLLFSNNSINMEFYMMMDWISCLFISVMMLISSMIMLYSMIYMGKKKFINRFVIMVILFIFSLILINNY